MPDDRVDKHIRATLRAFFGSSDEEEETERNMGYSMKDLCEHFGALSGDNVGEQRRHFRSGHKVARGAEFGRTSRIIAKSRSVQRKLHVLCETDTAVRVLDTRPDVIRTLPAVCGAVGVRFWQCRRRFEYHGFIEVLQNVVFIS